jgi:hypothetical protein
MPWQSSQPGQGHLAVSARQSGSGEVNRQFRDAVCDFADDSRHASSRAAAIYHSARAPVAGTTGRRAHPGPPRPTNRPRRNPVREIDRPSGRSGPAARGYFGQG